jgi:hypothetical protein
MCSGVETKMKALLIFFVLAAVAGMILLPPGGPVDMAEDAYRQAVAEYENTHEPDSNPELTAAKEVQAAFGQHYPILQAWGNIALDYEGDISVRGGDGYSYHYPDWEDPVCRASFELPSSEWTSTPKGQEFLRRLLAVAEGSQFSWEREGWVEVYVLCPAAEITED